MDATSNILWSGRGEEAKESKSEELGTKSASNMSYGAQSVSELLNWKKMKTAKYGKLESKIMNGSGKDGLLLASICVCKKKVWFVQECVKRAKEGITAQNFLSMLESRFV